ncbi:hypothetical protein ACHAXR_006925 [Thalassiosira sp. AJA248-18]
MSSKVGSPLTFKAGGKIPRPKKQAKESNESACYSAQPLPSLTQPSPPPLSSSNILSVIQTGISNKRSPFQIKNWIACVLTLDGRDKFTKVLQYTSRLLCWYFAGLAVKKTAGIDFGASVTSNGAGTSSSGGGADLLTTLANNLHLRQKIYNALSQRFNSLYKSLVTSRKAFRLGRSFIEWDKIRSMGWGDYLTYMLMHPLAGGVADGAVEDKAIEKREGMGSRGTLARYDTHPIPEEEGHDDEGSEDESSWSEDERSVEYNDDGLPLEEKKLDERVYNPNATKKIKVVSRPGRPKLPSRISSNIGWGPSTTTSHAVSKNNATTEQSPSKNKSPANPPPARTVSELGREMYQPFPSRSSSMGSYKQVKDTAAATTSSASAMALASAIEQTPPNITPSWKLIGGTIKLLGLMGFWAFDNLSFLTASGFLDPIRLHTPTSIGGSAGGGTNLAKSVDPAAERLKRKTRASEWAGRCYFFGVLAGLYVNARALWAHRNGVLKGARKRVEESADTVEDAKSHLKQTEQKHFELSLAFLKSCCDFMVFSNNPGIDLHLKLRGRKNHEGLHCLGGLVSASTVLYNNFPNAK